MILGLTHLADQSFWEAVKFDDDQIKAIVERGGVIGAAFDAWMLAPDWSLTLEPREQLDAVIDPIDYICQLAGNAKRGDRQRPRGWLRDRFCRDTSDVPGI